MPLYTPEKTSDGRNYAIIPIRATTDPRLINTAALTVLLRICTYTDRYGVTFVSQRRLAKDLGKHRTTINKHIAKLREMGYLAYAKKRYENQSTNSIKVIFDESIRTPEDAFSHLTAKEQMKYGQYPEPKQVLEPKISDELEMETHRDYCTPPVISGSIPPVASEFTHNVPTNALINEQDKLIRMCRELFREQHNPSSEQPTPDDLMIMDRWVCAGLTEPDWKWVIGEAMKDCHNANGKLSMRLSNYENRVSDRIKRAEDWLRKYCEK